MRVLAFLLCSAAMAQEPGSLAKDPAVEAALEAARHNEPQVLDRQARLCEIPAPPFHEEARGRELTRLFHELGLQNVHTDKAGNVIGVRPGASAHPNLVLAAHLDTVFPEGTDVKVTRDATIMKGPGIGDDCRGLAVMLGVIQDLRDARVRTPGAITFVADTGEEGLGDLRGMKELFYAGMKGQIDKFVSLDGNALGIVNAGVGSYRFRVTFKGPGGHSFTSFGMANPIQAMGRAIAKIDALQVPADPKTTFNVGRVGGGTSVNSIPAEAWMEVDMRSSAAAPLKTLQENVRAAVAAAVEEENRRWNNPRGQVSFILEVAGVRPTGVTPADSPIVSTAVAVTKAFGGDGRLGESSTDANIPMSLGIPAITIGGGGRGSGAHSPGEAFDSRDSYLGTQRALLLVVALAR